MNDVTSLTPHKNHRSQRGSLDRERRRDVRDGKKEGDAPPPPIVRGSTYVLHLRKGSARGAVCLEPHLRRRFAPPKREGPPRRFAPRSSAKNCGDFRQPQTIPKNLCNNLCKKKLAPKIFEPCQRDSRVWDP